ncbi:MAG: hypothetical protein ACI4VR_03815 [Bacilli bacterium]
MKVKRKELLNKRISLFVTAELIRFNKNLGAKPLVVLKTIEMDVKAGSNSPKEKISGIGYTTEYKYFIQQNNNSDNQINKIGSGNFKLFDKITLSN